ncbi:MAG: hypothetical protein HQL33_10830 [Alphaproteobacteria bacterium]|nr:hypothetical protein [Alphaproteobacteria bacterium]
MAAMIDAEDMIGLVDEAIHRVLRVVDAKVLVTLLAGGSQALRDRVLGAVANRTAAAIGDDVELRGEVSAEEISIAAAAFAAALREAAAAGDIPGNLAAMTRKGEPP